MKLRETTECPNCKKLARQVAKREGQLAAVLKRVDKLERDKAQLLDENHQLRKENEQLKEQLAAARKNSSNSSKPPSSDIVIDGRNSSEPLVPAENRKWPGSRLLARVHYLHGAQ